MIDINLGDQPVILWTYLGVLALTPVVVAIVGFFVTRALKQREYDHDAAERRREICKALYDDVGPLLNRIYCYITDLGDYGTYTPPDIIQAKRDADRTFYTYRTLWSETTRQAYAAFMAQAFETHTGVGVPAKVRALRLQKVHFFQNTGRAWNLEFDAMLTEEQDPQAAHRAYEAVVSAFVRDMTE